MSMTTDVSLESEKASKGSTKKGRKCGNPNRWAKRTACDITDSI